MATQTRSNPVNELGEKAVENGKKASSAYLDPYEKVVLRLADSYEKAASATKIDWIGVVASAQADLARDVTKSYTTAAREFIS
jgi:hypothetical protein